MVVASALDKCFSFDHQRPTGQSTDQCQCAYSTNSQLSTLLVRAMLCCAVPLNDAHSVYAVFKVNKIKGTSFSTVLQAVLDTQGPCMPSAACTDLAGAFNAVLLTVPVAGDTGGAGGSGSGGRAGGGAGAGAQQAGRGGSSSAPAYGDVRTFYNEIFIKCMEGGKSSVGLLCRGYE